MISVGNTKGEEYWTEVVELDDIGGDCSGIDIDLDFVILIIILSEEAGEELGDNFVAISHENSVEESGDEVGDGFVVANSDDALGDVDDVEVGYELLQS